MARNWNQSMLILRRVQTCRSWGSVGQDLRLLWSYWWPVSLQKCHSYAPRGGGDLMRELPCRCCIRYQVIIFYPQPTYSVQNSLLFWQKRSFLQKSFSRQRITKTMCPNSRQQDYQNKPRSVEFAALIWLYYSCFPFHYSSTLFHVQGFKSKATNVHKRTL